MCGAVFDAVGAFMEARHGVTGFSAVAWRLFESGVRGTTINLALEELGHPLGGGRDHGGRAGLS
jgi:hypothetical protein